MSAVNLVNTFEYYFIILKTFSVVYKSFTSSHIIAFYLTNLGLCFSNCYVEARSRLVADSGRETQAETRVYNTVHLFLAC